MTTHLAFLGKRIACNRLEGQFNVETLLGGRLEVGNVVLRLAPLLGAFVGHASRFEVHLVAEHDERKVIRITRTRLDQKLVAPRFQVLERIGSGYIEDQHTAVGASIEGNAQRLKAFLASCVPNLNGMVIGFRLT